MTLPRRRPIGETSHDTELRLSFPQPPPAGPEAATATQTKDKQGNRGREASKLPGLTAAANIEPMLRRADVCLKLRINDRTLSRLLLLGKVPKPDIKLGQRIVRWRVSTIERLIEGGGDR